MLYSLARPFLFALDPETAHNAALRFSGLASLFAARPPACPVKASAVSARVISAGPLTVPPARTWRESNSMRRTQCP